MEDIVDLAERMEDIEFMLSEHKAHINIRKALGISHDPDMFDDDEVPEDYVAYKIKDTGVDGSWYYNFVLDDNGPHNLYLPAGTEPGKFIEELNHVINFGANN